MDETVREQVVIEAKKHALMNAIKHEGDAQVNAIMGPLMGDNPSFREHGDEIPGIIEPVIADINALSRSEQQTVLEEIAPDLYDEISTPEEPGVEFPLPELPNADSFDEIRMRLAPNPNGPWHIGHARMPAVIGTYKAHYDGWFVCRFDDTDPETKRPLLDAYDWIISDISYLGFDPDQIVYASDRLETYYDHARSLIETGGAYTCSCPAETFSELKNNAEPCPHRPKDPETTRDEFEAMITGQYGAGEMVLRVATDITHPNPAIRDWVAFRQIETPHPRPEAAEYRCWPMLDYQSAIDDHLLEISHIIRGIDLQDSAKRQQFLYDYFDWDYPEVIHWGKVNLDEYDIPLSTSTLKERIEDGSLDGWDDPRAPTLRSLRRRGIRGDAITDAMIELGTSTSNVELSMSTIYAKNRELIDDEADRLFFVADGIEIPVVGGPGVGEPPVHPDHPDRGTRSIPVEGAVLVESDDLPPNGQRVWLKGFGCVRHTRDAFEVTGDDIDVVRSEDVDVIHWVPADENQSVTLRKRTGDVSGIAESTITAYDADAVIQFERVGFAKIDEQTPENTVAYFTHP